MPFRRGDGVSIARLDGLVRLITVASSMRKRCFGELNLGA